MVRREIVREAIEKTEAIARIVGIDPKDKKEVTEKEVTENQEMKRVRNSLIKKSLIIEKKVLF